MRTTFSALFSLLLFLPSLATSNEVTKDFVGLGQIHVLNSDSFFSASPENRIGCINEQGLLTIDDCAVFSRLDAPPHTLSSARGDCSFRNTRMPNNKDSWYGKNSYAWSCGRELTDETGESYYTVNGFRYPFVCNGNINCFYDIPRVPTVEETVQPVWQYFWGGEQPGITPGHMQVLWLWVPVAKDAVEV
ncbi:hypothetical protein QBC38DRAFT_420439 [Podospora fimiseda]|uniref:Uncharacterized protein n=1 Tax=Podospora fimiseda TaxID=252190 RepID=A0AAN7GSC7_9PEZI|nr:hypothetical protein QBC38DRAFT_420439 [Podospora fimiseda]